MAQKLEKGDGVLGRGAIKSQAALAAFLQVPHVALAGRPHMFASNYFAREDVAGILLCGMHQSALRTCTHSNEIMKRVQLTCPSFRQHLVFGPTHTPVIHWRGISS